MKKVVVALVSVSVGFGFAVLFLEIGLRLRGMGETRVIYDEFLGKVYRKDISNKEGFLTREFPDELDDNKLRVVLLGDSFTVTSYLPKKERFGTQLEYALKINNAQVFDLAVDGYGTNESLLAWSRFGSALKPAISVYNFYINDIRDNLLLRSKFTVTEEGIASHFDKLSWIKEIAIKGRLRSAVVNQLFLSKDKLVNRLSLMNSDPETLNIDDYVQVERYLLLNKHAPIIEEEWDLMKSKLRWWTNQNKKLGSVPIIVYTPTRDEVNVTHSYTDLTTSFPASGAIQARLNTICKAVGCRFFDLTPRFIELEKSGNRLYLDWDPHWNSKGVELATNLLANYMRTLLPGRPGRIGGAVPIL